ncbi:5374_t:CDS:1, partial [Gigaspora margarita]
QQFVRFSLPTIDLVHNFQQFETDQDPQIQAINQYQMTIQETQSLDQQFSKFILPAVDLI